MRFSVNAARKNETFRASRPFLRQCPKLQRVASKLDDFVNSRRVARLPDKAPRFDKLAMLDAPLSARVLTIIRRIKYPSPVCAIFCVVPIAMPCSENTSRQSSVVRKRSGQHGSCQSEKNDRGPHRSSEKEISHGRGQWQTSRSCIANGAVGFIVWLDGSLLVRWQRHLDLLVRG